MRLYKNVWFKHLCQVVSIVFLACTVLTGCKDNEPSIDLDDNEDNLPTVVELPFNDIIETTIDAQTVILADGLDEMSALFANRLTNANVCSDISSDTELVVFDEEASAWFVKDKDKYEQLKELYLRGGLIYFHKPALQAAALIARLEYEVFNEVPEETIEPLYDAYIFNIQGAEYHVDNIYFEEPREIQYTDEEGNMHTEVVDNIEKPSEYFFGRYAESAANFVNEALSASFKARSHSTISRAAESFTEPPLIPIQWDKTQYVSTKFTKKTEGIHKDAEISATAKLSARIKIRCAYSFDQDKDYYQITLTEDYPGSSFYRGHHTIGHSIYKDKYGGFALTNMRISAYLDSESLLGDLYTLEGVAPDNRPGTGTTDKVTGWTFGGTVGLAHPSSVAASFNFSYTSTTTISKPFSEMPSEFVKTKPDGSDLKWYYTITNPMEYYRNRGRNGGVNDFPAISTQDFSLDQTWCWVFANSSRQKEKDIRLNVWVSYSIRSGMATGGAGGNKACNWGRTLWLEKTIDLPSPHRYKDNIVVVASPVSNTSSTLRKLMAENSSKFRFIIDNPVRTGIVKGHLVKHLSEEWEEVFRQIKRLEPFSGVDEEVTFTLQFSNGDCVRIGDSQNTGIHIDKNGNVSMVK